MHIAVTIQKLHALQMMSLTDSDVLRGCWRVVEPLYTWLTYDMDAWPRISSTSTYTRGA